MYIRTKEKKTKKKNIIMLYRLLYNYVIQSVLTYVYVYNILFFGCRRAMIYIRFIKYCNHFYVHIKYILLLLYLMQIYELITFYYTEVFCFLLYAFQYYIFIYTLKN